MPFFRRRGHRPTGPERLGELTVTLCEGTMPLDVVGESYRQDNLWRLVGGFTTEYVRAPCIAVLSPENNPHDPNAVAVHISGLLVGYLPRETAARYRPGLVRLMQKHGQPIALNGQILGGGPRDDGIGRLGVFLEHDPADFVDDLPTTSAPASPHVRTGALGFAQTGGLAWLGRVPDDDVRAIPHLRKLLTSEIRPSERHYLYAQLEHHMYHSRNAFSSALGDYDAVCRDHDAEMDAIRVALIEVLGGVPLLEIYRQAAIRHEHDHDHETALWWAERGLAVYGERALSPEWTDDLAARAARCRQALNPTPRRPRPSQPRPAAASVTERLTCGSCGAEFERLRARGRKPSLCPSCRGDDTVPVTSG